MAGGMADSPYHKMGRDIAAELEAQMRGGAVEGDGQAMPLPEEGAQDGMGYDASAEMMDKVAQQLLDSKAFDPNTPEGIRGAYREAAKRVYQESETHLDPSLAAKTFNIASGETDMDLRKRDMQRNRPGAKRDAKDQLPVEERRPLPRGEY